MATRVRLVNAEIWPAHGKLPPHVSRDEQQSYWDGSRNAEIVIGTPVTATADWACGTDVVWPVLEYKGKEYHGEYFVCRHQIEAGD